MKKSTLLVIALCFVVCVVVCVVVFSSSSGDSLKESVIGTWEYERTGSDYAGGTCVWTDVIEIYKGGTGHYQQLKNGKSGSGSSSITWEIKDGVLNVTVLSVGAVYAYTYNSDSDTLTKVKDSTVFIRKDS